MSMMPYIAMFQSTRPYGARQDDVELGIEILMFQSTRPYGARLSFSIKRLYSLVLFQSTRPYGARLERSQRDVAESKVSIHAPVWGATLQPYRLPSVVMFQSTRPYGARRLAMYYRLLSQLFQSTRPYGARRNPR